MAPTTTIARFPYMALVRVPLVVDALLLLSLLAKHKLPEAFFAGLLISLLCTLPLELWAIARAMRVLWRDAPLRTWRHDLAVVCGMAQAAFVLMLLLRSSTVS